MPRKTKDQTEKEELKKKESTAKNTTATAKKAPTKKTITTKKAITAKKDATATKKSPAKKVAAKSTTAKKSTATTKASASTKKASTAKKTSVAEESKVTVEKVVAIKSTAKKASAKKAAPTKKASTTKKAATTTKASVTKKSTTTKKATATTKASVSASKAAATKKTSTAKKTATKKAATSTKKATTKKADSTKVAKKSTTKKATTRAKKVTKKALAKVEALPLVEYYDLPYRYNQTVVKLLAQTPTTLFVYWDISDKDRENYIKTYGEHFFEETKPVLIIKNTTMDYSFEVEINDFANSWYLHVNDSKCDYSIELGRRPVSVETRNKIETDYIYVTTSNVIESPNDRILFNIDEQKVYYRNVKNNVTSTRQVSFINSMGKIYNIYELYNVLYENEKEVNEGFEDIIKGMPSSAGLSSSTSSWFK